VISYKNGEHECKLTIGKAKFEECIEYLEKCQPVKALISDEELAIQLPEEKNDWIKPEVIKTLIAAKQEALTKITFKDFHFDIGTTIMDPEIAIVMQLVDDGQFNGQRRANIMNPMVDYLGISIRKLKTKGCAYFAFGSDK
jgi:ABC-type histidine transport system ATPase subunit